MNPLTRMLIAFSIGLVTYLIYWRIWKRILEVPTRSWTWSKEERRVRTGRQGIARVFGGWLLAFVIYALVIEDSGVPFSAYWWQETLFAGDWIGVLLFSLLMTFAEWHRASQQAPLPSREGDLKAPDGDSRSTKGHH